MGRKRKNPVMYDLKEDKAKLTKSEKNKLKDGVIKIGKKEYEIPKRVKRDKIARLKWFEIMELYSDANVNITTNADIGVLERYCLTYSDFLSILDLKKKIKKLYKKEIIKAAEKIEALKLEVKINQKNSLLLRMEGELFLTPLSKCRSIPRGDKDPKKERLKKKGFNV